MNYLFDVIPCDSKGREMPEFDMTVFESEKEGIDYYFDWYKKHGYPLVRLEDYEPEVELNNLKKFDETTICNEKMLDQAMIGCGFLWAFFPHWIDVSTYGDSSLAENWKDDKKLRTLIEKTYRFCMLYEGGRWSTNRIRQNAKVYCSKQSPSNFRPSVAKYLYNAYGDCGSAYDPCGGWGGRLFGFLASNCQKYVCCEPSTKSAEGLNRIKEVFSYVGKDVEIHCECAEDYKPQEGAFDMAFTSPPYFDCEHYSNERTQSYIKFSQYDKWLEGFLRPMIQNCHYALKDSGYLLLNVANTKNAPTLERESINIAKDCGFKHADTLYLMLSSIAGEGYKTEPIFVFEKI